MAKSKLQSQNNKSGQAGEAVIEDRLTLLLGVKMVERIETGWKVLRGAGGRITHAFPLPQVAGDFRGILPGGRSVLIEVKSRKTLRLSLSAFEEHQKQSLSEHQRHGGLSLVGFVCPHGAAIAEWPCGMSHGKGVRYADMQTMEAMLCEALPLQ